MSVHITNDLSLIVLLIMPRLRGFIFFRNVYEKQYLIPVLATCTCSSFIMNNASILTRVCIAIDTKDFAKPAKYIHRMPLYLYITQMNNWSAF